MEVSKRRDVDSRPALIVAPSGWWGSVGDDALLRGACSALNGRGCRPLLLTGAGKPEWATALGDLAEVIATRDLPRLHVISRLLRIRDVYIIGADIIDGGYDAKSPIRRLNLARWFAALGKRVSIVSFSFNRQPKPEVVAAFRKLGRRARYATRDRLSGERFALTTGLPVEQVADIGFLTRGAITPRVSNLIEWIRARQKSGETAILVNLNIGPFKADLATRQRPTEEVVHTMGRMLHELEQMHGRSIALVIVPHDFRSAAEPWSDLSLAQALASLLRDDFGERVRQMPVPFDSTEICAVADSADLVVTGRMHLAIISLAAGTIPLSFTYQDKFEGMYEHLFSSPADLMLSAQELLSCPAATAARIHSVLNRRDSLRYELEMNQPRVLQGALENFHA